MNSYNLETQFSNAVGGLKAGATRRYLVRPN